MDSAVLLDLLGNENRRRILRLLSRKPCYVTEISEYLGVSPKAVIDHLRRLEEAGLVESRTDDQRRKYFHIARNLRLEVSVSPYRFGAKSAYPASRSLDMRGRCQHVSVELPADDDACDADTATDPAEERSRSIEDATANGGRTPGPADGRRSASALGDDAADTRRDADSDASDDTDGRREDGDVAALARQYAHLEDVESELSLAQRWVHGRVTDVLDRLSEKIGEEADSRFYAEVLAALSRDARTVREVARELNAQPDRVEVALDRLADRGLVRREGSAWRIA